MAMEAHTIFCDDIRREDNGKALLIGVYTGDLVVQTLPAKFPLSAWIRLIGMDRGSYSVTINFEFPGGEPLKMNGQAEVNDPTETNDIFMVGFPATINKTGDIICNLLVEDQVYEVGRITVQKAGSPSVPRNKE